MADHQWEVIHQDEPFHTHFTCKKCNAEVRLHDYCDPSKEDCSTASTPTFDSDRDPGKVQYDDEYASRPCSEANPADPKKWWSMTKSSKRDPRNSLAAEHRRGGHKDDRLGDCPLCEDAFGDGAPAGWKDPKPNVGYRYGQKPFGKALVIGWAKFEKGQVPYGTRPFGRRALPNQSLKQVRAKAPRYGMSKSSPSGNEIGAACPGRDAEPGAKHFVDLKDGKPYCSACQNFLTGGIKNWWTTGGGTVKKSCEDCGAATRGAPVCTSCFHKAMALEKGYQQTCGSCKGSGCKTCGGKGKVSGNASAGMRGGARTRLSQVESHFRTQAGHTRVSKGWTLRIDREMRKSTCGTGKCGFSGNALQLLQHKKSTHPLNTRIETQKNAPKEKFGKSIEFKLLDENDPEYHGHAGGGAGYNTSKWVHMHGPVVYNGQMVGPKEPHKHFKMGAFTREHSPSGFQEHVLGRDTDENAMDTACGLPNCGHPMSQHIPADDGRDACTGCNDKTPRRNVRHTFRAS